MTKRERMMTTLVDAIPTENALAMYRTADEYGVYT
jgi:hypothetical protein